VAPVVDVDDGAFAGDAQERGVDHVIGRLPGRAHKHREHDPRLLMVSDLPLAPYIEPMDIYDHEPWTEMVLRDLTAALASGSTIDDAAQHLCPIRHG
jgi:hypothetical protein